MRNQTNLDGSPSPLTAPPQPKPSRKRRSTSPRSPRVLDPGVAAIHAEAKAKVAEYRRAQASGGILKTIIDKRLAQLTDNDRQKLYDALKELVTPALPFQKHAGESAAARAE